ncbi:protein FAM161B isoform X2 [Triplophysa dalaica]|uniref:protein FAM161B isoform X2 n=1 Tax=Triplophysa dalaica TaxID=1582913 RepID=UPI0024DF70EA|nr:protein FAM161B isoform X2 [Triplophysa dalaica]
MDQMTLISPTIGYSQSAEGGNVQVSKSQISSSEARKKSDFELHLEALKGTQKQQLENLQFQNQDGLAKRVEQNSLLSASTEWILKTSLLQDSISNGPNCENRKQRRVIRQNLTSNGIKTATTVTNSMKIVSESQRRPLPKETQKAKEEADLVECEKQFRVAPVTGLVSTSLYKDLIQDQERLRQERHDQRRDFLLAMQKPFRFHKREDKKQERRKEEMASANTSKKIELVCVRKPIPKAVSNPRFLEKVKEQEQQRKIRIQLRAQETLKSSSAPIQTQESSAESQSRSAQKTKSKMLGYLDQMPSFRPKTNTAVPDFDKLHHAFQQKAMEKAERKDVTHCKPFQLHTSTLLPRSRSPENLLDTTKKMNLKRSSSFGGLTSLSMDTLPTYITDAARRRSMAIRRSLELKDLKEQANAEWMRQHRIKSQAISKAVAMRAKAMDPHKSLKEVYQEKLKQHRQADLERIKDYQKELKDIKTRVTARPYLFEQVSQKNAKVNAERRYRDTLEQAGLNETFVQSKGESDKCIHGSNSVDGDSENEDHCITNSKTQQSSGSGDDSDENEEDKEETKKEDVC